MEKQLEEMTIRKAENGGHVIRHEFKRKPAKREGSMSGGIYMERPPSEEHVFGPADGSKVMAHVGKHLGLMKGESTKGLENADEESAAAS